MASGGKQRWFDGTKEIITRVEERVDVLFDDYYLARICRNILAPAAGRTLGGICPASSTGRTTSFPGWGANCRDHRCFSSAPAAALARIGALWLRSVGCVCIFRHVHGNVVADMLRRG